MAEKKSPTLFSVKWFASTCLNFTTHKCMVNRMFNAIHEQSPACLKCPNMHKFAHIECATLYDNAQIRRLSCVDSWVTQVKHEITWTNALSMNRLIQNHAVENGRSFICALHTHNKTYFLSIFGLLLHKQILFIT